MVLSPACGGGAPESAKSGELGYCMCESGGRGDGLVRVKGLGPGSSSGSGSHSEGLQKE